MLQFDFQAFYSAVDELDVLQNVFRSLVPAFDAERPDLAVLVCVDRIFVASSSRFVAFGA